MLKSLTFKKDENEQVVPILGNVSKEELGIVKDSIKNKENNKNRGENIFRITTVVVSIILCVLGSYFCATYNQIPAKELSSLARKYPFSHNGEPYYFSKISVTNFQKAFEAIRNPEIIVKDNISGKAKIQIYNNLTIWQNNTGSTFYTIVSSSTVLSWINEYVTVNNTLNYQQYKEPYSKVTNTFVQNERLAAYHNTKSFGQYNIFLVIFFVISFVVIMGAGIYLAMEEKIEGIVLLPLFIYFFILSLKMALTTS